MLISKIALPVFSVCADSNCGLQYQLIFSEPVKFFSINIAQFMPSRHKKVSRPKLYKRPTLHRTVEPLETVQMNIYQSNTCRKEDEPRVQDRQQMANIPTYSFLQLISYFQVAARTPSPDMATVFHARVCGRFTEIQSNLRRKNQTSLNKSRLQFS